MTKRCFFKACVTMALTFGAIGVFHVEGARSFGKKSSGTPAWIGEAAEAPPPRFLRFACDFVSDGTPLVFDVSADQRYILLLDGEVVGRGPDAGDIENWHVRRMELRPRAGKRLIEAVVWSLGVSYDDEGRTSSPPAGNRPFAHLAYRTSFFLRAAGSYDAKLTTGIAPWRYAVLEATRPTGVAAADQAFGIGPEYEVRGTGVLDERPDASAFRPAAAVAPGIGFEPATVSMNGGITPRGRRTVKTVLPQQLSRIVRPGDLPAPMTVPPHTAVTNVFDLGDYYCAYPVMKVKGGRGARVSWGWTEALRDPAKISCTKTYGKADRSKRGGMVFSDEHAIVDEFVCDGRDAARFTTPWWRCGRWCRITVQTGDEALELSDIAVEETRYPAVNEGFFEADGDDSLPAIARMSVRGLQMCMHEIMFDCPFYEQQMYGGDIRVSFLGVRAMTRDERLIRQCLRIFDSARDGRGYIPMNWPSVNDQHSTTWTLSWIIAVGDYSLWHSDRGWLAERMPGVEHSLMGVGRYENARGLLENAWGWNYLDWTEPWKDDACAPPGAGYGKGESAALNLLYLLSMQKTADAWAAVGDEMRSTYWRTKAGRLSSAIRGTFFDEGAGILADTPRKTSFSEHVQALAVLTGCVKDGDAVRALAAVEAPGPMTRCSSFFLCYLFEACKVMDRGDLILKKLDTWRDYVRLDLKCPLESVFFPRSDCHSFGAHPLYHFHTALAGVSPDAPFFGAVRVAPSPGPLKAIRAKTPHPKGFVEVDLAFTGGSVTGKVTLPEGVAGRFVWKGTSAALRSGANRVGIPAPPPVGR